MTNTNEGWLLDTGLECAYDSETIEYMEPVIMLSIVAPTQDEHGGVVFEPILIEDHSDFLYPPVFFQAPNWDRAEEDLRPILETSEHETLRCLDALLTCSICSSGIISSETTGLLTFGMFERSTRNPNGQSYGSKFEADIRDHAVVCIACLRSLNDEVITLWEDGVCHDTECQEGTQTRCWRAGCAGGCDDEDEEEL